MIKYTDLKLQLAILKLLNPVLSPHLPQYWGLISPIHRSGDECNPNNDREVCVNSNLGQVLCMIINSRLLYFYFFNNAISKNQIGFLPNDHTTDHIFTLSTLIVHQINQNRSKLFCCFVDFFLFCGIIRSPH